MTIDEAILTLKDIKKFMFDESWLNAVDTAIEALEKLKELRCKYCENSCEPIIEKNNQSIYCVCANEMRKEEVSV